MYQQLNISNTCTCDNPRIFQLKQELYDALDELEQLKLFCLTQHIHPLEFEEWRREKEQ